MMGCTAFSSGLCGDLSYTRSCFQLLIAALNLCTADLCILGTGTLWKMCGQQDQNEGKADSLRSPGCSIHLLSDYFFASGRHPKFMAKALTLFATTGSCKTHLAALFTVTWAVTTPKFWPPQHRHSWAPQPGWRHLGKEHLGKGERGEGRSVRNSPTTGRAGQEEGDGMGRKTFLPLFLTCQIYFN